MESSTVAGVSSRFSRETSKRSSSEEGSLKPL